MVSAGENTGPSMTLSAERPRCAEILTLCCVRAALGSPGRLCSITAAETRTSCTGDALRLLASVQKLVLNRRSLV